MADIEKVLKGLECCKNGFVCGDDCPYRNVCINGEDYAAFTRLASDALELLKSQPQIVRCKDCKHYHKGFGCDLMQRPSVGKDLDWFCADGERN